MWIPKTETDIESVILSGELVESAHLDVKRSVGETPGSRSETAKDLASFALFGGLLLVGVDEDKASGQFSLAPQPLANVPEKIEQIAASRVDPPLFVRVTQIPSEADPALGYLAIEVPPSGTAPHMVDSRYYARGDRTTRRLTDAEVVMHHERRRTREGVVADLLREEVARDPWRRPQQNGGHLFVVAEPLQATGGILLAEVKRGAAALMEILTPAENAIQDQIRQIMPTPFTVNSYPRRARGMAATTFPDGGRQPGGILQEVDALDIEFQEDGGVRAFCGRLTDMTRSDPPQRVILDGLALAYALRVVFWARAIATLSGYRGSWGFGLAATGLEGAASNTLVNDWAGGRVYPYDRDTYEHVTSATLQEVEDDPAAITNRLIGPFLRGVGTADRYAHLLGK